jgi:hypothetical protein
MKKRLLIMCTLVTSAMSVWADNITFSPLQYETLPNMQVPRRGHVCFATASGDIVAVGGHTTNFNLTTTAERLHDGVWESISINNPHDGAACVMLPDGRVLVAGGFSSRIGVGQSTVCDIYDPATNSFSSTGNMQIQRAFCNGIAIGDGNNVLMSGNWYASDATFELWDGNSWTSFGNKEVELNNPFLVNAGNGIAYVFGCRNPYGSLVAVTVWRVDTNNKTAETVADTGLEEYELVHGDYFFSDTPDGDILLLGKKDDKVHLLSFSAATAKVTEKAVLPATTPSGKFVINYSPGILVNKSRKEAYIVGGYQTEDGNHSLNVINYNLETGYMYAFDGGPFPGALYWGTWVLQPTTGNLIFTGGSKSDNFDPVTTTISVKPYLEQTTPESDLLVYEYNETDKTATVVQRQVWAQLDEYHSTMVNSYYGDIVIPEKVNGYTVTAIADYAFMKDYELGISSVVIPKTVKKIGNFAFLYCNLLRELTIPATVEYIGEQIIYGSGVRKLTVEDSDQPLTACVAANNISPLSDGEQCTTVYVGRNIVLTNPNFTPEYGAFTWAGYITDLTFGPLMTRLNNSECWRAGALQRVTFLTDKVTVFPENAFGSCSNLVSIQLPAKLERIETCGISGSQKLKSITLPATLRYLGQQGLDNSVLETIYIQATTPPATEEGCSYFESQVLENCKLYVPNGTQEAYQTANVWKDFQHIIGMDYTGINAVSVSTKANVIHSLDGRRVENPTKGIYIMNGKKVVIK